MRVEFGSSHVSYLMVLLVFCIAAAVAWPWLMGSREAEAQAKAASVLKAIHEGQRDFFAGRGYYGTEQQLREFGVLSVEMRPTDAQRAVALNVLTYEFTVSVHGGRTRWCAAAIPSPSGTPIAIDETGAVQTGRTCEAGVVK